MCKENFSIVGRIWINCNDDSFIGNGKIELLERIKQLGSLRKAAAEMKMSYRQAWINIDKMNKASNKQVVILKRGGREGGIAQITEFGEKILITYKNLQSDFEVFLTEQTKKLNDI